MNTGLALVGHYESRKAREARIDAYAVDRSRYLGDAGIEALRKLPALEGAAAARRDRCKERTQRAKLAGDVSLYRILQTFAGAE